MPAKAEGFGVTAACAVAEISTSAFYEWAAGRAQGPGEKAREKAREEAWLAGRIMAIHDDSDATYGSPRIHAELVDLGWVVKHKRVERLMRDHDSVGVHTPATVRTTVPAGAEHPEVPDLLKRDFSVGAPGCRWVGDITYTPTGEGWLYLSSVLDLGSRRFVGYAMADHMRTDLVTDALTMAVGLWGGQVEGTISHSDRGSQYLSADYRAALASHGIR